MDSAQSNSNSSLTRGAVPLTDMLKQVQAQYRLVEAAQRRAADQQAHMQAVVDQAAADALKAADEFRRLALVVAAVLAGAVWAVTLLALLLLVGAL
jgi:membrane protein involved in colicin uptake